MTFVELVKSLRESRGLAHKRDIETVLAQLGIDNALSQVAVGDDCAAIATPDGYLLLAIEGFLNEFVEQDPWFAGWCGVMVNLSDVAAMGGHPVAVVDALWSRGEERARPILEGMAAASAAYGVPIVGGHSNTRTPQEQLSVAVLGRAKSLLSSFTAEPGHALVAAIDLRGSYRGPFANWNAATDAPPERLRSDLALLPKIAETGLAKSAKDISQAGLVGTTVMLFECSDVGGDIDLAKVPRPEGVPLERWLTSFPSFGYILSTPPEQVDALIGCFEERGISTAHIGSVDDSRRLQLRSGDETAVFWDLDESPLMGCTKQEKTHG